jgi:hypothetical protein
MKGALPISCPKSKVCYRNRQPCVRVDAAQVPHPNLVVGPPIRQGRLPQAMKNRVNSQARRSHGRSLPPNPHDRALRTVQEVQALSWTRSRPARAMEKTDRRQRRRPHLLLLLQARSVPRRLRQHDEHAEASPSPSPSPNPSPNPAADLGPGPSDGVHDHLPPPPPPRVDDPHDPPPPGLVQIWKGKEKGWSLQRLPVSGSERPAWPGTRRRRKGAQWKKKKKAKEEEDQVTR